MTKDQWKAHKRQERIRVRKLRPDVFDPRCIDILQHKAR